MCGLGHGIILLVGVTSERTKLDNECKIESRGASERARAKEEEEGGGEEEFIQRIVHTRGAIPNEVGPTRSRATPLKSVGRRDQHSGLPMPACRALAAVTLIPWDSECQLPPPP